VQFQRYASARRLHQALPLTRAERVEVAPDGSDVVLDRVVCHSCIVIRQSAPGISLIRETVAVERRPCVPVLERGRRPVAHRVDD
jgi:hypothetical protein